ncbi:hypothetical protein DXU92_07520 [Brachybacterium saurashtrense]|uniref:Glycoside hydrolase family 15 n=1 Tax=Brachybacterium saurashtrense TaxID=556288 RepID=A0A345YT81_9MICO|nr:hypothetical protein DWV08_02390 [Brachybacterium saurashtrense]RRR23455.1 hypothetical protein DXU92_07520 [Brachybacterium saurashtrense]
MLGAAGAGGVGAHRRLRPEPASPAEIPLWSQTVAFTAAGRRQLVGGRAAPLALTPGTRLAAELPDDAPVRARARAFLDATAPWRDHLARAGGGSDPWPDLARSALLDLWVLGEGLPAPVAGWSPSWRYIWPRDAAFCAVALARVGHPARALAVLEHLQSVQADDGWFQARYDPWTGRAPDRRPRQFDGTGLVLWACAEVAEHAGATSTGTETGDDAVPTTRGRIVERLTALIGRSSGALHAATRGGAVLPPVSPDYWETRERSVTLGSMAATLTGLRAGALLTGTDSAHRAAETFTALLEGTFGATGYQRYRAGGGADSALALLDATGCHGVAPRARLRALRHELARPGGGITPGAAWREDGVSWTPSTSLLGLALARSGHRDDASEILRWVAAHRTEAGSLPEKVLHDGRPAEVAPLAWTAANVLLALDELAHA